MLLNPKPKELCVSYQTNLNLENSLFIGGEWVTGQGEKLYSYNPADSVELWSGNAATPTDVDAAFKAARAAFKTWGIASFDERLAYLKAFLELLTERKDQMAAAISAETGKVLWDAAGEVGAMLGKLNVTLQAYEERTPTREKPLGAMRAKLTHRPHGVMAVFGPYNFPGHLPNGHIMPALLAGNTIVFKPSEKTPMVGAEMIKLWQEAGLPAGVINLVQGARETGETMVNHRELNGLLFTGSVPTGQAIARTLIGRPNVIQALELGGNNPLIVTDVNDLEAAALITINSAFITSGQRCTCARRLIVPTGAKGDQFLTILVDMIKQITVGSGEEEAFMGPVIDADAADAVLKQQKDLLAAGGKSLVEATRLDAGDAYLSPGLIDVTQVANRKDDEIFGPLLQVIRVDSLDSAIDEANNTDFGLAAGLLSDDAAEYQQFYASARAGIVNWNQQLTGASSAAPFGGIGSSGNYRPSAYYAADYVAYPMASVENPEDKVSMPALPKGIKWERS